MHSVLILLSGGLDSSTLLHWIRDAQPEAGVHALSLHYGQRHSRELDAAAWQARATGVSFQRVEMAFVGDLVAPGTTLVQGGAAVPALDAVAHSDRDQPPTYVPNRNMILLAIAAARAEALGIGDIYYGAQVQDEYGYWDCTVDFLARMNHTLALNRRTPVTIHAPFVGWRKAEIIRCGISLGVDYAHTWTCYRGGSAPCGVCPACVERAAAFAESGVHDPLLGGEPIP